VEEIMASNVIEVGNGLLADPEGSERAFLFSYPAQHAKYVQTLAQEDAALDAEDILTQAHEANALDSVGG
jgi:hypothetical protein